MRLATLLILLLLACLGRASAQGVPGAAVNQVSGPPPEPFVQLLFYDGSSNLQYLCYAKQVQPVTTSYSVAAGNLTNIVVATNVGTITATGHKLYVGARLVISGSATSALNGTYSVVTSADANTLTITTSGVSDGTYTDFTAKTQQPLTNAAVWGVKVLTNPSSLLSSAYWALPSPPYQSNSGVPLAVKCDDRTKF